MYLWQRLSRRSILNGPSAWSEFHPQTPFTATQCLYILCMNLLLYNLCSQFKSTQKSLDAAEHLVYSDLCYGTLSSIRNQIIWFATEKGRKHGARVFSQTDPLPNIMHLSLLFEKKKKKVTATPHSMAVWPPPSSILSHCLKTINISKLHEKQEALTYVLIADVAVESMIWCQNDHHFISRIEIKFN